MPRFMIAVNVPDDWADTFKDPKVKRTVQDALDRYWDLASMGTVEVVGVYEMPEPSETERIGPLG